MRLEWFLGLASMGVLGVTLSGCVVQNDPPSSRPSSTGGTPVGPPAGGTVSGSSQNPMLVDVDPNVTMTATPGDGVGVFTEYVTGGHWHVWWTCDTNKTSQSCNFDVKISAQQGTVTAARSDQFGPADTLNSSGSIEAVTNTTTNVEGVYFDAAPGGIITLEASIGGVDSGQFLFFVQKGQVNGGFSGTLTDPLMLEGAAP